MKDDQIQITAIFKCTFTEGLCKYKNPENFRKCIGCKFAILEKQTPPVLLNQNSEDNLKNKQTGV